VTLEMAVFSYSGSMNRRFGVPALAGSDRLKAGHQTNLARQSGSRSQCTAQKSWGLSMNLAQTNPPLTPPRRGPRQAVRLPSLEGLGVGSWSQCMRKSVSGLSMNRTRFCSPALIKSGGGPPHSKTLARGRDRLKPGLQADAAEDFAYS